MAIEYRGEIVISDIAGSTSKTGYRGIPDTSPRCYASIYPRAVSGVRRLTEKNDQLQITFQCVKQECQEIFIGIYLLSMQNREHVYRLAYVLPWTAKAEVFSDQITKISPAFCEIYNQSLTAEIMSLSEIVGIGLRKSLEFLIKDFTSYQNPNKEDDIKKSFLGNVIKNYVNDPNVKRCAELAVWLGNDEAHYLRKWENKDISDLKTLIRLTVNWIDNVLLTEKYVKDMSSP